MSLVNRIKQLCAQRDLSLHRLEMTVGFSKSSISKWDVNTPSADKVLRVADYFDVSVDYLLGRTEYAAPADVLANSREYEHFGPLTEEEKRQLTQYLAFLRSKNTPKP